MEAMDLTPTKELESLFVDCARLDLPFTLQRVRDEIRYRYRFDTSIRTAKRKSQR